MSQSEKMSENPFALLRPVGGAPVKPAASQGTTSAADVVALSNQLQSVFYITLNTDASPGQPGCVFLPDLHSSLNGQTTLDLEHLKEGVFERLMQSDPEDYLVTATVSARNKTGSATERQPLLYLFHCFARLKSNKLPSDVSAACKEIIMDNLKMVILHPEFELFPITSDTANFIKDIFKGRSSETGDLGLCYDFLSEVNHAIVEDKDEDPSPLRQIYKQCLDEAKKNLQSDCSLGNPYRCVYLDMLLWFTRSEFLAEILLEQCQVLTPNNGRAYEDTLLGSLLSIGCLSKDENTPNEFFDTPSTYNQQQVDITTGTIHAPLSHLTGKLSQAFLSLLKVSPKCKNGILSWIGGCLDANKARAKIWTNQMLPPMMFATMYASDTFFLNLCTVLLQLSRPFSQPNSPKLLKILPTYCMATAKPNNTIHMKDISDETGLIPLPENESERLKPEESYNFISECFYMTEYALKLGFHVVHERFHKVNQELGRIQSAYNNIQRSGQESSNIAMRMKDVMEKKMCVFLSIKAALTEPTLLQHAFQFHVSTATWLVQLATGDTSRQEIREVTFPLPATVPVCLSYVPEFVAENLMDFLVFVRRYKDDAYEDNSEYLNHLMTFILVFMGSPDRMRNPHFRANMAEALEALMPPKDNDKPYFSMSFVRESLFREHPHSSELARTLLQVFVGIEMTGQGVEFEQKFNYRRPMYSVLEYLCDKDNHRKALQQLAVEAEENVEATDAPLFLRFCNLLINDAIFLLDEALQYMSQIKEKETEREAGSLDQLAEQARQEAERDYQHLRQLARFHNIMASETIGALQRLTSHTQSIFVHPVLVERISAMLNYFLKILVGPKSKEFKVKNFEEFDFKPQDLVGSICKIYLNLGGDPAFCSAVSRDGRSYSHELFIKSAKVLQRIGTEAMTIRRFAELGVKVRGAASAAAEEEDIIADAPEHFLDPIMGTLMRDPVKLPSSGNIMDRQHIARHILSDQIDPFNRQPLSMDMIIPADELKAEIKAWLEERGLSL